MSRNLNRSNSIGAGEVKVVDAFCGPGGLSLGLMAAGYKPVLAFDIDERSIDTYRANIGCHGIAADARDMTGDKVRELSGLNDGSLDLLAGGPPCQGFSKQKRGAHLGDNRNSLVMEFVRLAKELSPRAILFENVAIFGQKRGAEYLARLFETLDDYEFTSAFLNSADYGLAQTRQRFVLVGIRHDIKAEFAIPKATTETWQSVGYVLQGLPEPPGDFSVHPDYPNHQRTRVTQINIERFSHVPQGGGWQDIPRRLQLPCHQKADTTAGGWPDVYGRLRWDGQCPTITGGFDSFTRGRYGHPLEDRPITPREAARLQGFPDSFVFFGNRHDVRHQIGNAVPPPLAEAVGNSIQKTLRGETIRSGQTYLFARGVRKVGKSSVKRVPKRLTGGSPE